jgi:hypothetical protein
MAIAERGALAPQTPEFQSQYNVQLPGPGPRHRHC